MLAQKKHMKCRWCKVPHDYYLTSENALRQNCRCSDNGYHDFVSWWDRWWDCFRKPKVYNSLLRHRRAIRPNTI